jgi:hypothetical protein
VAEFPKFKKKSLPEPPPSTEASENLAAPENAPNTKISNVITGRLDGRSLRRSGRTVQFATRVTPEFDHRIRHLADTKKMLIVEILEDALDLFEASR